MIRYLILIFPLLLWGANVESKIKTSKKKLEETTKEIKGVNLKLSKLAKEIKFLQTELKKIDQRLETLDKEIQKAHKEYKSKEEEYEKIQKQIEKLTKTESKLKRKLVVLISNRFSKAILMSSIKNPTLEDVLKEETLKAIQRQENERIKKMSKTYLAVKKKLKESKKRLSGIKKEIEDLLNKKSELRELKVTKSKKYEELVLAKKRYDETLEKLIKQQKSLLATLKKLKIIKQRRRSSKRLAKVKVKNYGQKSYKRIKTVRYKGKKTIPPLDKFVIVKKYGTYRDPIYNIKIPNENVELKPLQPNAKVKNVLNGRIVLAKWTPHLKNVVIVQHSGGLYTIYAYLDKLAPYVKKGRKIKKGYVLGRVNNKLIFEVTKNNAHINPLDLIRVK